MRHGKWAYRIILFNSCTKWIVKMFTMLTLLLVPCLEMQCLSWHGNGVAWTLILPVRISSGIGKYLFLNF